MLLQSKQNPDKNVLTDKINVKQNQIIKSRLQRNALYLARFPFTLHII